MTVAGGLGGNCENCGGVSGGVIEAMPAAGSLTQLTFFEARGEDDLGVKTWPLYSSFFEGRLEVFVTTSWSLGGVTGGEIDVKVAVLTLVSRSESDSRSAKDERKGEEIFGAVLTVVVLGTNIWPLYFNAFGGVTGGESSGMDDSSGGGFVIRTRTEGLGLGVGGKHPALALTKDTEVEALEFQGMKLCPV